MANGDSGSDGLEDIEFDETGTAVGDDSGGAPRGDNQTDAGGIASAADPEQIREDVEEAEEISESRETDDDPPRGDDQDQSDEPGGFEDIEFGPGGTALPPGEEPDITDDPDPTDPTGAGGQIDTDEAQFATHGRTLTHPETGETVEVREGEILPAWAQRETQPDPNRVDFDEMRFATDEFAEDREDVEPGEALPTEQQAAQDLKQDVVSGDPELGPEDVRVTRTAGGLQVRLTEQGRRQQRRRRAAEDIPEATVFDLRVTDDGEVRPTRDFQERQIEGQIERQVSRRRSGVTPGTAAVLGSLGMGTGAAGLAGASGDVVDLQRGEDFTIEETGEGVRGRLTREFIAGEAARDLGRPDFALGEEIDVERGEVTEADIEEARQAPFLGDAIAETMEPGEFTDVELTPEGREALIRGRAMEQGIDPDELRFDEEGRIRQPTREERLEDAPVGERLSQGVLGPTGPGVVGDVERGLGTIGSGAFEMVAGRGQIEEDIGGLVPAEAHAATDALGEGVTGAVQFGEDVAQPLIGPPGSGTFLGVGEQDVLEASGDVAAVLQERGVEPVAEVTGDVARVADEGFDLLNPLTALGGGQHTLEQTSEFFTAARDVGRGEEQEQAGTTPVESVTQVGVGGALGVVPFAVRSPQFVQSVGEGAFDASAFAVSENPAESAAGAGAFSEEAAREVATMVAREPVRTGGLLAATGGVFAAARRVGPRTSLATRGALQPGEELLGRGGAAALRTAPGGATTRAGQVLFPRGEPLFASEEAAMMAVGEIRRRAGRLAQGARNIEAPSPSAARSALSEARARAPGVEIERGAEGPPLQIEPALRQQIADAQARFGQRVGEGVRSVVEMEPGEFINRATRRANLAGARFGMAIGRAARGVGEGTGGFFRSVTDGRPLELGSFQRLTPRSGPSMGVFEGGIRGTELSGRALGEGLGRRVGEFGPRVGERIREATDPGLVGRVRGGLVGAEMSARALGQTASRRAALFGESVGQRVADADVRGPAAIGEGLGRSAGEIGPRVGERIREATDPGLVGRVRGGLVGAELTASAVGRGLGQRAGAFGPRVGERIREATDPGEMGVLRGATAGTELTARALGETVGRETAQAGRRFGEGVGQAFTTFSDIPELSVRLTAARPRPAEVRLDPRFVEIESEDVDLPEDIVAEIEGAREAGAQDAGGEASVGSNVVGEVETRTESGVAVERVFGEPEIARETERTRDPLRAEVGFDRESILQPELGTSVLEERVSAEPAQVPAVGQEEIVGPEVVEEIENATELRPGQETEREQETELEQERETEREQETEFEREFEFELESEVEREREGELFATEQRRDEFIPEFGPTARQRRVEFELPTLFEAGLGGGGEAEAELFGNGVFDGEEGDSGSPFGQLF